MPSPCQNTPKSCGLCGHTITAASRSFPRSNAKTGLLVFTRPILNRWATTSKNYEHYLVEWYVNRQPKKYSWILHIWSGVTIGMPHIHVPIEANSDAEVIETTKPNQHKGRDDWKGTHPAHCPSLFQTSEVAQCWTRREIPAAFQTSRVHWNQNTICSKMPGPKMLVNLGSTTGWAQTNHQQSAKNLGTTRQALVQLLQFSSHPSQLGIFSIALPSISTMSSNFHPFSMTHKIHPKIFRPNINGSTTGSTKAPHSLTPSWCPVASTGTALAAQEASSVAQVVKAPGATRSP